MLVEYVFYFNYTSQKLRIVIKLNLACQVGNQGAGAFMWTRVLGHKQDRWDKEGLAIHL